MGGLGQFVSAHSENKAAAWEWIKHLNSGDYVDSRISDAYVDSAGQPARISMLSKYAEIRPHFVGTQEVLPGRGLLRAADSRGVHALGHHRQRDDGGHHRREVHRGRASGDEQGRRGRDDGFGLLRVVRESEGRGTSRIATPAAPGAGHCPPGSHRVRKAPGLAPPAGHPWCEGASTDPHRCSDEARNGETARQRPLVRPSMPPFRPAGFHLDGNSHSSLFCVDSRFCGNDGSCTERLASSFPRKRESTGAIDPGRPTAKCCHRRTNECPQSPTPLT